MDISGLGTYSSIPLGLDFSFNGGDYRGRKGSAGISLDLGNSRQRGWSSLENTAYLTSEKQEKAFEVNRM